MKPNDLRIALQESLPEPPEGFDARSEQKLVSLLSEEEHKVKKITGLVIAIALILVISMATALAAFNEDINRLLYQWWPEAARALRPVNLSMENDGIRLEVLSASVSDENMLVTFSLTDMTGDRINENTQCEGALFGAFVQNANTSTELLSYDPEIHQAVFAGYTEYSPLSSDISIQTDNSLYLTINGISSPGKAEISLLPLMTGKDYTAELVPFPGQTPYQITYITEDADAPAGKEYPPVLNPENSLEIPLFHGITLSGIGWIDGIMHVQIHKPDCEVVITGEGFTTYMHQVSCDDLSLYDQKGEWVPYRNPGQYPCNIQNLAWTNGNDAWCEFLFPFSPEEVQQYTLRGEFSDQLGQFPELLADEWSVEFPASMIQTE